MSTSTIATAPHFSGALRKVSPGAKCFSRWPRVTWRHVGRKAPKPVNLDTLLGLVMNRSDSQVALGVLKSLSDGDNLDMYMPPPRRILFLQIGR